VCKLIQVRFGGKVLDPEEPLDLPVDEPLELELRSVGRPNEGRLKEMIDRLAARPLAGHAPPAEALRRENLYE
jgi:hypothetical protein